MNHVETRMAELGHLRFAFERGRYTWFALQPGLVDYKYRLLRDLQALNKTTLTQPTPVALFVDSPETKLMLPVLAQFPRWKILNVGALGLATETPMAVCTKTASLVLVYGNSEWCSAFQGEVAAIEDAPEVITRKFSVVGVEHRKLTQDPDPNSGFNGDVERLRHWTRTPALGLQVRETVDMRPAYKV